MNEWKKSYSKKNWAQKHEEEESKRRERFLLSILETNFEKLEQDLSKKERLKVLKKINEAYESLRVEAFSYDVKEAQFIKEQLKKIEKEVLEEEIKRNPENQSWEEYKEEER